MEVGQLIVHKEARVVLPHILNHIGGIAPVAEAGAVGSVHQVSVPGAEGEGGEKNRLTFEAFR